MPSCPSCLVLVVGLGIALLGCGRPAPPSSVATADELPKTSQTPAEESAALAIFQQRIVPILQAARPSSCAECHLSGVDLKDYIRPTQGETFSALVQGGLVDVDKPDESKLLTFIARKPAKPSLVSDKIRQEEYAAFQSWIRAAVREPALLEASHTPAAIGPQLPPEVIRHARADRVLASFIDNVWSEVGRCASCHSPDRNQKQVREHGEQVSWITLRDPQATLAYMLDAGLIDPENPEQSLLLAKPTLAVKHGGGQKMVVGDRTYKQFRRFIDDYAAMVHSQYKTAAELPPDADEVSQATEIWLKVEGVPERFDKQLMQVDLYRFENGDWSPARWATSDRLVFGQGKLWQHSLSVTAPADSPRAEEVRRRAVLPPGKYLAKLYVDQTGKLTNDFRATLGEGDLVGQVEVTSNWPASYGKMTVVKFPSR